LEKTKVDGAGTTAFAKAMNCTLIRLLEKMKEEGKGRIMHNWRNFDADNRTERD